MSAFLLLKISYGILLNKNMLYNKIKKVVAKHWKRKISMLGRIQIKALFADRIEWYLDDQKIKTKYNTAGLFTTELRVKNLIGKHLKFKFIGIGGEIISKYFEILPQEVI